MVEIQVFSYKRDKSAIVDVANVTDENYNSIKAEFLQLLSKQKAYEAISEAYVYAVIIVSGGKSERYLAAYYLQNLH